MMTNFNLHISKKSEPAWRELRALRRNHKDANLAQLREMLPPELRPIAEPALVSAPSELEAPAPVKKPRAKKAK